MRQLLGITLALCLGAMGAAWAKGPVSGPGRVDVGVDASTWESNVPVCTGCIPIGGAGQVNGEFTTVERNGIQIGIRAQERFAGTLDAISNKNGKVGIYTADTGFSDVLERATWNYDIHVDLRDARGVAAGTTLVDYDLSLVTDIATVLDEPVSINLISAFGLPDGTVLWQTSQNPKFGNLPFAAEDEATYFFRLVLTPKTFNGPPLAVEIEVDVVDP